MLLRQLEDAQSFDATIDEDLQELGWRLLSLLPGFYVNFERRIFLHRVAGRIYESVVPDGWQGAQGDFVHLIPVSQRYWVRNADEDFWMIPWLLD